MNPLTDPQAGEPRAIVKGDTVAWRRDDLASDYAAADGWALSYLFVSVGGTKQTVVMVSDAEGWKASADTSAWPVGQLDWYLQASHATFGKTTVSTGKVTVSADPASAGTTYDPRSHARKVLESIEAVIEARASKTDLETTLADGRQIKRLSHKELLDMRDAYAAKVRAEERRSSGKGPGRVLVRL